MGREASKEEEGGVKEMVGPTMGVFNGGISVIQ